MNLCAIRCANLLLLSAFSRNRPGPEHYLPALNEEPVSGEAWRVEARSEPGDGHPYFCLSAAGDAEVTGCLVNSVPATMALRIWLKRSVSVFGVWGIKTVLL